MPRQDHVNIHFENLFRGYLEAAHGRLAIGRAEKDNYFLPYDLLLGALGSCFYSTFLGKLRENSYTVEAAHLDISGLHREEIPQTLTTVTIKLELQGTSGGSEEEFRQLAQEAARDCSIHETVAQVAKIELEVAFQ